MIQNQNQVLALQRKARETLEANQAIAVIGWMESNHSPYTRSLPKDRVLFYEKAPLQLPQSVGYVLFTRFITHSDSERLQAKNDAYSITLGNGQIKTILQPCQDILLQCKPSPRTDVAHEIGNHFRDTVTQTVSDRLLEYLTEPSTQKEIVKMTSLEKFAKAFTMLANNHADQLIGCRAVRKLRESCGVTQTNSQLAATGWIESVIASGKSNIGWYKAGRLMLVDTTAKVAPVPETPAGRIEYLIAQKPTLIADIERLEAELVTKKAKLAMIADAEVMLSKIDSALLA